MVIGYALNNYLLSTQSIVDNVKDAVKLAQQLDNVDLIKKLLDVQNDLMNMQDKYSKVKEEKDKLKKRLKTKEDLVFFENNYYFKDDEKKERPYCTKCFDDEGKLINMHVKDDGHTIFFKCPKCKANPRKQYREYNLLIGEGGKRRFPSQF